MPADDSPSIPLKIQPDPSEYSVDLPACLDSVLSIKTRIPENALTASALGTEREGHGVVIGENGLILTIGYIVTEAESVWLIDHSGATVQGHVVAYDQQSGFGLVQALGSLDAPVIPMGLSSELVKGQKLVLAGAGGVAQSVEVEIADIREFAGYWEYLLDAAIFTAPAHPFWGGAALIGEDGRLYGIGSLILQTEDQQGNSGAANMVIPIDLLPPIFEELQMYGKRNTASRPWLGWFVQETRTGLVVAGVVDHGPAAVGGVRSGDVVAAINGEKTYRLPDMYRQVWSSGQAGVEISVAIARDNSEQTVNLKSVDRNSMLVSASLH